MTTYIILRKLKPLEGEAPRWEERGSTEARGAGAAIRQHIAAGNIKEDDGTFVAVPARSFQEVVVKTETQTRITFS